MSSYGGRNQMQKRLAHESEDLEEVRPAGFGIGG